MKYRSIAVLCLLLLQGVPGAAAEKGSPSRKQVQLAVEKGLFFVEHRAMIWWKKKKCFSCHESAMLLFSHNIAKQRGIPIDQQKLDFWTDRWWYAGALRTIRDKKKKTVGGQAGLAFNLLYRDVARDTSADTAQALAEVFRASAQDQQPTKKWTAETTQIPWIALSLASLEKSKVAMAKEVRAEITTARQKTEAWIKKNSPQPAKSTETLTGWVVFEHQRGNANRARLMLDELLARQSKDGSWGLTKGTPGHCLVTGLALFSLKLIGRPNDDPAVHRARQYLLQQQEKDGRWPSPGRIFKKGKRYHEADAWATGIVCAALTMTLPKLPPGTKRLYQPDKVLVKKVQELTKVAAKVFATKYLSPAK